MLANAETRQLRFSGCRMPGFDGGGLRVDGFLSLSGSEIEGRSGCRGRRSSAACG
ncbi:hypothetical protein ACFQY7_42425 [Actinomadura luteofluorescens]|uniref:hypothetical protein n=1 Tax=Actinomadura luteofluorescens TaxID=46163 RepID=UPI003638D832